MKVDIFKNRNTATGFIQEEREMFESKNIRQLLFTTKWKTAEVKEIYWPVFKYY